MSGFKTFAIAGGIGKGASDGALGAYLATGLLEKGLSVRVLARAESVMLHSLSLLGAHAEHDS